MDKKLILNVEILHVHIHILSYSKSALINCVPKRLVPTTRLLKVQAKRFASQSLKISVIVYFK